MSDQSRFQVGDRVVVRTAFGEWVERRAVSDVMMGSDFLVVRICDEDEWNHATREQRPPVSTPWPAEDVREAGFTGRRRDS